MGTHIDFFAFITQVIKPQLVKEKLSSIAVKHEGAL